jgi:plastocyanin
LPMLHLRRALNPVLRWRPVRGTAPLGLMAAAPVLALVVAACSGAYGGGAATNTYAPPSSPSGSPAMSMSQTASEPAVSAAPAASAPASAAPIPPGSPAAAGAPLHIAAQNIQFDTDHLEASAGQNWVLVFANNDAGVPHNVEILDATGASVFRGDVVTGPTTVSYRVPALGAGTYKFFCDVHPTMTGTLTVR